MSAPTTTGETTFADFGLDPAICDSLAEVGITSPFPIQELTLPLALSGADIIGQARTGTGKTLGFGLPMLQHIDVDGGLQVLIIVPTRELCLQVSEDLAQAGRGKGVTVAAVYGGKAMQPQIDAIAAGCHLIVGTPGRLLDLSRRGFLDLSRCSGLVLDEADEMLDLGFLPDVETLIEMCASTRQTLLFSATMPAQIVALARRYMTKPTFMRAEVEEVQIAPQTQQYFFSCHRMDKPAVLARILQTPHRGLTVVFCRTKRMADILADELRERDVKAAAIHSGLRQEARERALEKFRKGSITVLCATEVAARGLDIDDVTHVVNYDCPDDEKMYLHRIGRTGRAGAAGVAITFAVYNEIARLEMIRRELDVEEEILEVFSTSPILDELFDLPPREETRKVPSPPPARKAVSSRSKRRAKAGGGRRVAAAEDPGDTITRTRTRRRDRGGADGEDTSPSATEVPTRLADDDAETSSAEQPTARSRTRRRRRRGRGEDGTEGRGGGPDARDADDGDAAAPPRATEGGDGRGDRPPRRSTPERGASRGKGTGRRPTDANTRRGTSEGGGKAGDGRRRGSRRDRGDGRNGERPRRSRRIDASEARGSGRPRLTRQLEVTHLP